MSEKQKEGNDLLYNKAKLTLIMLTWRYKVDKSAIRPNIHIMTGIYTRYGKFNIEYK